MVWRRLWHRLGRLAFASRCRMRSLTIPNTQQVRSTAIGFVVVVGTPVVVVSAAVEICISKPLPWGCHRICDYLVGGR